MTEEQINERIMELQESMEKRIPAYKRQVKQAFDIARARVSDIIAKHEKDGVVPKTRVKAINEELAEVERELYRNLLSQTTIVLEDVATDATEGLNEALVVAVGVTALLALQEEGDGLEALSTAGFLLAIGVGLLAFIKSIASTVISRKGDDDLDLRDRLENLAQDVIADVSKSLRKSIQSSEDYSTIQRNVAKLFKDTEWRLNRIVDTEAGVAYRTAIARAAQKSELVEALKIIDFPHGAPGVHEKHKCYIYAQADEHGMGKGVYPVGTKKIRNPHPQCTSRLVLVMKEGVLDA